MIRIAQAAFALALASAAGHAAASPSPVPVTACRVGAIDLRSRPPPQAVEAALRRAFPKAAFAIRKRGGGVEQIEARDGGERLMAVSRQGGRSLGASLYAPRFTVAEGVGPGTGVARAEKTLGPATLEANPTTGDRDLTFADPKGVLHAWSEAGCSLRFVPGPGPKARARIASIEIETP